MSRSVFYGVGAFVGSVTGPTNVSFWPDDPVKLGWNASLLVGVDLARNPEAVRRGTIVADASGHYDVDVDDFAGNGTGGLTRIGPLFPGGTTVGTCYLEESKCAQLGAYDPRASGRPYEWATVVYYDGALAGRRFYGFHGKVTKATGRIGLVSLWGRGWSAVPGQTPFGTYWIDFDAFVHAKEPGFTTIDPVVGSEGAVFIDQQASGGGVIAFDWPKSPRWIGGAVARRSHHVH